MFTYKIFNFEYLYPDGTVRTEEVWDWDDK